MVHLADLISNADFLHMYVVATIMGKVGGGGCGTGAQENRSRRREKKEWKAGVLRGCDGNRE